MTDTLKIEFNLNGEVVFFTSGAYQKTNGQEPRNFVFYDNKILIENRDLLTQNPEKDMYGRFVNCDFGEIYYKPASGSDKPRHTNRKFVNNIPFNPNCIKVSYNQKSKIIEAGYKFYIDKQGNIVKEQFDPIDKIILSKSSDRLIKF